MISSYEQVYKYVLSNFEKSSAFSHINMVNYACNYSMREKEEIFMNSHG